MAVWNGEPAAANLAELLPTMVNPEKELNTPEDVLAGVQHILAEVIAECADVRGVLRAVLWDTGVLTTSKSDKLAEGEGAEYKDYFEFKEPIRHIPPHRVLAINRGEKVNALSVKLEWDSATGRRVALERLPLPGEAPTQAAAPPPAAAPAPEEPVSAEAAPPAEPMPPAAETPQPPVADAPGSPTTPESAHAAPPPPPAPHRNPGAVGRANRGVAKAPAPGVLGEDDGRRPGPSARAEPGT